MISADCGESRYLVDCALRRAGDCLRTVVFDPGRRNTSHKDSIVVEREPRRGRSLDSVANFVGSGVVRIGTMMRLWHRLSVCRVGIPAPLWAIHFPGQTHACHSCNQPETQWRGQNSNVDTARSLIWPLMASVQSHEDRILRVLPSPRDDFIRDVNKMRGPNTG